MSGNLCKRGGEHGILEYTNPKRMLTTTVFIEGGEKGRLSVVSKGEIPKDKIFIVIGLDFYL